MAWFLTEFIGMKDDKELYVATKGALYERDKVDEINQALRSACSDLRYYQLDDVPGLIVTEEEALPYRREI